MTNVVDLGKNIKGIQRRELPFDEILKADSERSGVSNRNGRSEELIGRASLESRKSNLVWFK